MTFDKEEFLKKLDNSRAFVLSCVDEYGNGPLHVKGKKSDVERIFGCTLEKLGDAKYNVLKNVLYHLILDDVEKVKIENSLEILRTIEQLFKLLEKNMKGEKLNEANYS